MNFLGHLIAKKSRTLIKRMAPAMLAGFTLLFVAQFVQGQVNSGSTATAITACGTVISQPGKYFLANDLKNCPGDGIDITVSNVEVELRGHTIAASAGTQINANGGSSGLSNLDIEGPGSLAGGENIFNIEFGNGFDGQTGIIFQNVHFSQVHDLVVEGNQFGIAVNAGDFTSDATIAATASTQNVFSGNVITDNFGQAITVNGGNQNLFLNNNLSGNFGTGLLLFNANNNVVRNNTADMDTAGIQISAPSSGNVIDHNTALGEDFSGEFTDSGNPGPDLLDGNGDCAHNTWGQNSFDLQSPACSQQIATPTTDDNATPITACGTVISQPGRYFLANDLKMCPGTGISITASQVQLELRGHSIEEQLFGGSDSIDALGGSTGLSYLDIEGPGTVAAGLTRFQNVHVSLVHNLVLVQAGIELQGSTYNVISGNTVGLSSGTLAGIFVDGGGENLLIGNNSSNGATPDTPGIFVRSNNNVIFHNSINANSLSGIQVLGSGNLIEGNTALNNVVFGTPNDLQDDNFDCTRNTWIGNSFAAANPGCIQ